MPGVCFCVLIPRGGLILFLRGLWIYPHRSWLGEALPVEFASVRYCATAESYVFGKAIQTPQKGSFQPTMSARAGDGRR